MRRAATLSLTALLLAGVPGPILSQTSPPAAKSLNDQVADVRTRIQANETARNQALKQCDLDKLRQLAQEASDLLKESNRLLDAVQADPNSSFSNARGTNGAARLNYNQALLAVTEAEEKCRKQPEPDGGAGVAPVQSPTPTPPVQPTLPPPFGFGELWADAMKAFQAHYSGALNCDPNGMRSQRAKLEIYARDAEKRFGKIRRNKGFQHEETKSAEAYKKAIEALWQSALTMTPLNCPRTSAAPGQPQQQFPEQPEQQQQQEVPQPPEHGLRFTPPDQQSQRFLARINYWRGDAGMTALTWDRDLAASAQARGVELAQTGLAHRARTGPRPVGENLLQNLPGQRSIEQMIDVWGNEKRYFVPGIFPNISTTGDWSAAGHYSQMVWGGSQWVGCAAVTGGSYQWTICHFFPVGNKDGKNVLAMPAGDVQPFSPPAQPGTAPPGPPPPPPPPTARDQAPGGDESKHPLVDHFRKAQRWLWEDLCDGEDEYLKQDLEQMRYAIEEMRKRLEAAKKAGRYSAVKPEDVQKQIDEMEKALRRAENAASGPKLCPVIPQPLPPLPRPSPEERG